MVKADVKRFHKTRLLLVNLENVTPYVYGIRSLSSILRSNNFDARILYTLNSSFEAISKNGLQDFEKLCSEFDIIGFSFYSSQFYMARKLTEYLKSKLNQKIIVFGGIDPTIDPDRNIKVADVVCTGEGEDALLNLAENFNEGKITSYSIPGMWFNTENGVIKNPPGRLREDFSVLPIVDNRFDEHYLFYRNKINKLNNINIRWFLGTSYMTITSFGCPMSCAYCFNSRMKDFYPKWSEVRRRPVEHIIKEIKNAIVDIPRVSAIDLVDDNFGSAPVEYLKEFKGRYKKEIGLPVDVMGMKPNDITAEKLDILKDLGVVKIRMGIQSVDKNIKKIFNRSFSNEFLLEKIRLLNKYKNTFYAIRYDFIIDSPWDTRETFFGLIEFISSIPRPFQLNFYTLAFFPGTKLYTKALDMGLIKDSDVWEGKLSENFMRLKPTWSNLVLMIINLFPWSILLLRIFLYKKIDYAVKRAPVLFFQFIQAVVFLKRWVLYILHGDTAQVKKVFLYMREYNFLFK